jgi:hypothetical protein
MQKLKELAQMVGAFLMANPKLVRRVVIILAGLLGYSIGEADLDFIDYILNAIGGGCK